MTATQATELLAELERRMTLLEGIARGETAVEEGRTLSQAQAKQRMARWLKYSGLSPRPAMLSRVRAKRSRPRP